MSTHFDLIIMDTYGVALVRSPRYLELPLIEAADEATRELTNEERTWKRFARKHRVTPQEIEQLQDEIAAKYCKNLDLWRHLPRWAAATPMLLVHGGPPRVLAHWRERYDLDRVFPRAVTTLGLGETRYKPELYRRLADEAALPPERCLVVDDERLPVQAARDAGLRAYRYGSGFGLRALIEEGIASGE